MIKPFPKCDGSSAEEIISGTAAEGTLLARRLRRLSPLFLSFAGIITALIFVELFFRLIPIPSHRMAASDRPRFIFFPEGTKDRRNPPYPVQKSPDTFRMIVIGDSFTYGGESAYDDNYPRRLERMLQNSGTTKRVEVLNWGIPGFSTLHEIRLVRRALSSYSPDLILLQVTLNDAEVAPYQLTLQKKHELIDGLFSYFPLRHWKSFRFLSERIFNSITHHQHNSYYQRLYQDPQTWNGFVYAARGIADMCKEAKVPVVAALFPLFSHPFDDHYPFLMIHKKITTAFREMDFPTLDLRRAYAGMDPMRLQAQPAVDAHPNEIAHRIAAEEIYRVLMKQRVLPSEFSLKREERKMRFSPWFPEAAGS